MCGLRSLFLFTSVAVCGFRAAAQSVEVPDSTQANKYAIVLYAGGGLSWFPMKAGTPSFLETSTRYTGPSAMARLAWLPDHRLRLCFESGWTTFYSYNIDGPGPKGKVELVAVPLLLEWCMPITQRFSLFAGYGTYRITSKLDHLGTTRASTFSLGYVAAVSYVVPLGKTIGLNAEVKWFNAAESRHTVLAAQAGLVWKLFSW